MEQHKLSQNEVRIRELQNLKYATEHLGLHADSTWKEIQAEMIKPESRAIDRDVYINIQGMLEEFISKREK